VIAVAAYFEAGYIPFMGFDPGTLEATLWPTKEEDKKFLIKFRPKSL
jgi:hypothetical protein